LGGKAEAAGRKRRLDVDLAEAGDEGTAFQPLFEGPGGVLGRSRLDNEQSRWIEAGAQKTWSIRVSPFPCRLSCQAPQHETAMMRACACLYRLGHHGQGEAKSRRAVAIGLWLEFVEAALLEAI
jgi:hypothetical protein